MSDTVLDSMNNKENTGLDIKNRCRVPSAREKVEVMQRTLGCQQETMDLLLLALLLPVWHWEATKPHSMVIYNIRELY